MFEDEMADSFLAKNTSPDDIGSLSIITCATHLADSSFTTEKDLAFLIVFLSHHYVTLQRRR
jgi:hypothetical protein